MKINHITCGRFDNHLVFNSAMANKKSNYFVRSKLIKNIDFEVIGTNGVDLFFRKNKYSLTNFFSSENQHAHFLVSTQREYDLLIDFICVYSLTVTVIEISFPIFRDIKFFGDAGKNFEQSDYYLKQLKSLNIKGASISKGINKSFRKRAFKNQKMKDSFDSFFGNANTGPYREVFKFKEERKDKTIIALDVNSMYLHMMKEPFMSPGSFRSITKEEKRSAKNPKKGLYRVRLSKPYSEFISNYHPFKIHNQLKTFPFYLEKNNSIETVLTHDEIVYFQKHFDDIVIVDGIIAKESKEHPLLKTGQKIFSRKHDEKKIMLNSLRKMKLVHLHSSLNPSRKIKCLFGDRDQLDRTLMEKYGIDSGELTHSELFSLIRCHRAHLKLGMVGSKYSLISSNFHSSETVQSFSHEIISRSKIFMMDFLERILSVESTEICYVNVDSVHVSIDSKNVSLFFEKMSNFIGNDLGKFKIEAIADKGYWFDVGRYFLFREGELIKFKNINFNTRSCATPFTTHRTHPKLIQFGKMVFKRFQKLRIEDNFTYRKKIVGDFAQNINFARYSLGSFHKENIFINETLKSNKIKLRKYLNLKRQFDSNPKV